MKKKKLDLLKLAEDARRKSELKQYGRILSLRPSIALESKKKYKRTKYRYEDI